jgi:hypothetical protein
VGDMEIPDELIDQLLGEYETCSPRTGGLKSRRRGNVETSKWIKEMANAV